MATITTPSEEILVRLTSRLRTLGFIPFRRYSDNTITVNGMTTVDLQALVNEVADLGYKARFELEALYGITIKSISYKGITSTQEARNHTIRHLRKQAEYLRQATSYNEDLNNTYSDPQAWPQKIATAERVLEGTASATDLEVINLEIQLRGLDETAEELAVKQIEKSVRFRKARSIIDGITSAKLREVATKSTSTELKQVFESHLNDILTKLEELDAGSI